MTDIELTKEILTKMNRLTDPDCLGQIQNAAFNRKRDVNQQSANIETATWCVGDPVQLTPENRSRKPYDVVGTIQKINKVKMKVRFGDVTWTVPKSMLMKAE